MKIESKGRFDLESSEDIYWLEKGELCLHAEIVDANDNVLQAKKLFVLKEGEFIFGIKSIDFTENEQKIRIFARALVDCQIKKEKTSELVFNEESSILFLKNINNFFQQMVSNLELKDLKKFSKNKIKEGEVISFKTGMILCEQTKLQWCRLLKGKVAYEAEPEDFEKKIIYPLFEKCVLEAKTDSELLIIAEENISKLLLKAEKQFLWSGISSFGQYFLKKVHKTMLEERKSEKELLRTKVMGRQRKMNKILDKMVSLFTRDYDLMKEIKDDRSELLTIVRLVAVKTGMKVDDAQKINLLNKETDDLEKQIQDMIHKARLEMRVVWLRDQWWQDNNGCMIAFTKDEEGNLKPLALLPEFDGGYKIYDAKNDKNITINDQTVSKNPYKLITKAIYLYIALPLPDAEKTTPVNPLMNIKAPTANIVDLKKMILFGLQTGRKSDLCFIFIAGLFAACLGLISPIASSFLFSTIIPDSDENLLIVMCFCMLMVVIATFLLNLTKVMAINAMEANLDNTLQMAVWEKVLSLPVQFFRQRTVGELVYSINGVAEIRRSLSGMALSTMISGLFSVTFLIQMYWYSWFLSTIATAGLIVYVLILLFVTKIKMKIQAKVVVSDGKMSGLIIQILNSISKIRVAGAENIFYERWGRLFAASREVQLKARKVQNAFMILSNSYQPLIMLMLFVIMIKFMQGSPLDAMLGKATVQTQATAKTMFSGIGIPDFVGFNTAFGLFYGYVIAAANTMLGLTMVPPLYNRIKPIIEAKPEISPEHFIPGELQGKIEIGKLNFRYSPNTPFVLNNMSFKIEKGEYIAIVGTTGCGKSSLIRLLLGFEKPSSGSVLYDDKDLQTLDIRAVRSQIGVVLQNSELFPADIYKNIVGISDLPLEEVWEALRLVGLAEDIKSMPLGINTMVGIGSSNLSGGQKQRIMLARALVRKPKIILLDEATSALDNITQSIITETLQTLEATKIVVAHRISTIVKADKILVMDKGTIAESGTFSELIKKEGLFKALAKRQI